MVSTVKRIIAALMLMTLAICLTACGEATIVGKWNITFESMLKNEGITKAGYDVMCNETGSDVLEGTLEFTDDGLLTVELNIFGFEKSKTYNYFIEENELVISTENDPNYQMRRDFTLDGRDLTMDGFGIIDASSIELEKD